MGFDDEVAKEGVRLGKIAAAAGGVGGGVIAVKLVDRRISEKDRDEAEKRARSRAVSQLPRPASFTFADSQRLRAC